MKAVLAPTLLIQVRTVAATNSGPLFERMWPSTPRAMNKFASTPMTSAA